MAAEALKEYLVKLGWDVDNLGLAQANSKIDGFKSKVMGMGTGIAGNFLKAGLAVFSFIGTTNLAMMKLLDSTAKADLAVERFARKMWTTEENARSFLTALDAMDASYQDIFYMTPEEYNRFMDLKNLGSEIQAPKGLQDGLKLVRDIGHEFNRLKVIVNYATQWVSYYLTKYLGKDLTNIRDGFRSFNDWLIAKIPTATEKIAKFFTIMFKLGKAVVQTIGNLIDIFKRFWDSLSSGAKKTGGVIARFVALLAMGPIGWFIAGLLTILALLDDFYTWQRGGKSAFGDTWEKLTSGFGNIDMSGLDDLSTKFNTLFETIGKVGGVLWDLGGDLVDFLDDIGFFNKAWEILIGTLEAVVDVLQTIADLVLLITGNFDKMSENSIFRKIIKFDENGDVSWGKTAANTGMGILDSISNRWNMIFGAEPGDWYYAMPVSDIFGYDYGTSTETAVRSGGFGGNRTGGGFGGSFGAGRTFNQTNNINVTAAPGESAEGTAQKTSRAIIKQRNQYDPFK